MKKKTDINDKNVSVGVLAEICGLSVSMVYNLTKEKVLRSVKVSGESGRVYPLVENTTKYIAYIKKKAEKRTTVKEELEAAKLTEAELKNRKLEAQVALTEGTALDAHDVRRVWNDIIGTMKVRLWNMPQTAAERLVNISDKDDVVDILTGEVAAVCELLRGYSASDFFINNPDYIETEGSMSGED